MVGVLSHAPKGYAFDPQVEAQKGGGNQSMFLSPIDVLPLLSSLSKISEPTLR